MKGLLIKDFLVMKIYSKMLLLMLFLLIGIAWISGQTLSSGIIILMFMILCITSLSYDEQVKWDSYALSMPIPRKILVLSKYVLSIILILTGACVSLVISGIYQIIKGPVDFWQQLLVIYVMILLSFFFVSIMLPVIYRFGVEKGRIILFLICFSPAIISTLLSRFNLKFPSSEILMGLFYAAPVIVTAIFIISLYLSYIVYMKKEF